VHCRAAAEDLTQDTFAKAWSALQGGAEITSAEPWLHRIAVNTAISWIRRQRLHQTLPMRLGADGVCGEAYNQAEDRALVDRALAALSPLLRETVALHWYAGLTRDQIAERLGVPPGTVASRLGAAKTAMREALVS